MSIIEDMGIARQHLWKFQERFNYSPDLTVEINRFRFNMNAPNSWWPVPHVPPYLKLKPPYLKIEMEPETLRAMLDREDHFNNIEIGCRLKLWRKPDVYLPDVHTLLSFFHLPKPIREDTLPP